jgi:apolipoprotein N-acyltransferase
MKPLLVKLLAATASGCLLFFACADFDIWPLAYLAFLPLLLVTAQETPRRAFLLGWLCGWVANAGGFYWISNLLMRFGHLPWLVSLVLFLLLAAYQGVHFGLFLYLLRRLQLRRPGLPLTLLLPVIMTALELIMPFIFPWYLAITQAWVIPVIQVADLTGPLGVTFLLMLVNGLLADLFFAWREKRPWPIRPLAIGITVVALSLVYGVVRMSQIDRRWQAGPKVKIGLVQANIGIVEKGRAVLAQKHLQLHHEESQKLIAQGAQLLVWPESSYPYAFERSMDRDWPEGHPFRVMRGLKVPLLFGVLTYGRGSPYPYNSALMMEPDGRITGRFDKNFLLIFGEYIPFYEHIPSFKKWFPAASNFARGTEVTTFPFGSYTLGPLICYEDIIPAFTRRLAPLKPNLLVNITNDAWFGQTSEPYEHMALSVYRAVELRLGMVRAVNTGVSAFIDATGRVYRQTKPCDPVITPGIPPVGLLDEVHMLAGGETVYAAVGELFGYLNLLGVVVLWIATGRRTGQGGKQKGRGGKQVSK